MKNNRSPNCRFFDGDKSSFEFEFGGWPASIREKKNENFGFLTILPTEISPGPKAGRGLIYGRLSYNAPENSASFFSETSKGSLF